jgi:hypothetical protein
MPLGPVAMQRRPFGKSMTRAATAAPPLREMQHRGIVPRHLGLEPPDPPAAPPKPQAKFGLLPGDQILAVSPHFLQGGKPHQRIAAAGLGLAHRGIPFRIGQPVVDRGLGMDLAPPPADHREIGPRLQIARGRGNPARVQLAIAIEKLHEFGTLRLGAPGEPGETGIASAGGGEGKAEVKLHHLGPAGARRRDGAIGRAAVDIDHLTDLGFQAVEAGDEPRAFIAADHHRVDPGGGDGLRLWRHDISLGSRRISSS